MRILIFSFLLISITAQAQVEIKKSKPLYPEKSIKKPCGFGSVESLKDIKEKARPIFRKHKIVAQMVQCDLGAQKAMGLGRAAPTGEVRGGGRGPSLIPVQGLNCRVQD